MDCVRCALFDDAAGFEFTDTEWFALQQGPNGALVRSTRPERHGATPMAVSTAPVKLEIFNMGHGPYVYSALP